MADLVHASTHVLVGLAHGDLLAERTNFERGINVSSDQEYHVRFLTIR